MSMVPYTISPLNIYTPQIQEYCALYTLSRHLKL